MKNEFQIIADLIEKDKKVLDVGCADGTLMKFLKDNKNINIRGLEISKEKVQECIAKGLTVIEGNAEKDLKQFPDKSFDYVVLSQTLQAFLNPELVLDELLRVGKKAIVTIPNFGYWKVRFHLLFKGTMPITKTLPDEWYNTPNLHMCTIKDFFHFIKSKDIKIFKSLALNNLNSSIINIGQRLLVPRNSLNSSSSEKILVVSGYGSGHGVGMSQWGAKYMANKGEKANVILKYFYKGVEIKPFKKYFL